eukprot:TRINITY_DN33386_c0_g1_i1.p1 TRINITY_DN33386_c0_g1~~TRINITY_DN33386_c0_g1_i1.p1  ORF type:complete len:909 (+),score=189.00 TRINITY_DN33386_c0_g1_i1:75-2729(+)
MAAAVQYPVFRGSTNPISIVFAVEATKQLAYVMSGDTGLVILNVSDPYAPYTIGSYDTEGHAFDVQVIGDIAYVADFFHGIDIINVSNPKAPTLIYNLPPQVPGSYYYRIQLHGDYALATSDGVISIANVTDPLNPGYQGIFTPPPLINMDFYEPFLLGDYVYLPLSVPRSLLIYDVSVPWDFVLVCNFTFDSTGEGIANYVKVVGDLAYVGGDEGLFIVNVSNVTAPVLIGQTSHGYVAKLDVEGHMVYALNTELLRIIDVSIPQLPVVTGTFPADAYQVFAAGKIVYLSAYYTGIMILDVSTPFDPVLLRVYSPPSTIRGVAVSGNYAYVNDQLKGTIIYDVSNPSAPRNIGEYPTDQPYTLVRIVGDLLYVGARQSVTILNVSVPSAPKQVGVMTWARGLDFVGDLMYLSSANGFYIYNISVPAAPVLMGSVIETDFHSIVVKGQYAFVIGGDMNVMDVSDPANPFFATTLSFRPSSAGQSHTWIVMEGSMAYTSGDNPGTDVAIFDLSTPASPLLVGFITAHAQSVAVTGSLLCYGDVGRGLVVVNVSDPTMPTEVGSARTPYGPWNIATVGGRIYVADSGLFIYDVPVPTLIGCFKANPRFFTRVATFYSSQHSTPSLCSNGCYQEGYEYAGTEGAYECYCTNSLAGSVKVITAECDLPCSGDSSQLCGGPSEEFIRMFSMTSTVMQPAPSHVGCFEVDYSAMDMKAFASDATTVQECTSVCEWNGYKYAGLRLGNECWCGTRLPELRVVSAHCNLPCAGDPSHNCGSTSPYEIDVHILDGSVWRMPIFRYQGCFYDSNNRALPRMAFWDEGCTVEECVAVCAHGGYSVAGLQYRSQCWCGHSITTSKMPDSQCRMHCAGNNSEICGYAWRNSVYSISI